MHHKNMVHDVVEGSQEVLQQEQALIKNTVTIHEPQKHVKNEVQDTQQQLVAQMQQMRMIMQAM